MTTKPSLDIEKFAVEMIKTLNNSIELKNWKGNDKWWYLSQMAKSFRGLEDSMKISGGKKDITQHTCKIALYSMIINDIITSSKK